MNQIVFCVNVWRGTFFSVCNQPPRSTHPGHPFVGRRNGYHPKAWFSVSSTELWHVYRKKMFT